MKPRLKKIISLVVVMLWITPVGAEQVGLMPVPVFTEANVQAQISFDSTTGLYTYSYTITNPTINTGEIGEIDIDISRPTNSETLSSQGLIIPYGVTIETFDAHVADMRSPVPMVSVGIVVPSGWYGSLGTRGVASFLSFDGPNIFPGETRSGFGLISRGLPTIRQIKLIPEWVFLVESEEIVTPEEEQRAREIEASLPYKTKTLGPTAPPSNFSPFDFLNTIRSYVNESATLVWLMDTSLTNTILTQLTTVRTYLNANDPSSAKAVLQEFMTTVENASLNQRTSEAYGLLYYNALYLKNKLPDTYIPLPDTYIPPTPGEPIPPLPPPVPILDIAPKEATLPIGSTHILIVTAILDGKLLTYPEIKVLCISGPNAGRGGKAALSEAGSYSFSYTSNIIGTDEWLAYVGDENKSPTASITWEGGPDLTIDLFIPPLIKGEGGKLIPITEVTGNHGNYLGGPSITRYFLSTDETIDPLQDRPLGERDVGQLNPGESSEVKGFTISLPSDLPVGTYHLGACADAYGSVPELNEGNNCQINKFSIVMPVEIPPNQPSDCTQTAASPDILWPPNHELVTISISGITDPDRDPVTVTITQITQDEPTNGLGDGDTSPDGFGIGSPQAKIRAERSGKGNGRVYAITFRAEDGKGGSCTGSVNVGVPHDQGNGKKPIDDGQIYNSN